MVGKGLGKKNPGRATARPQILVCIYIYIYIYSRGLRHSADPLSSNRRMLDGGSCVGIILHVDAIRSSEH